MWELALIEELPDPSSDRRTAPEPRVPSPLGTAAQTTAALLRHAARTERSAVYVPHPEGGYSLWGVDKGDPADQHEQALRLHWYQAESGWIVGAGGHYLIIPLGHEGRAGLACLGPVPAQRLGPVRTRAVKRAAQEAGTRLVQASIDERKVHEHERMLAEKAAADLISGSLENLRELLLRAIKVELDADETSLSPTGELIVVGGRRTSPAAVSILEEGIRQLGSPGDDRLMRYRTLQVLADAVDARAPHTFGHSMRVMKISNSIAKEMDCDRLTRRTIEVAARLHDVAAGFCGSQALSKIKLDDVERIAVRRHPELGAAICIGAGLPTEVAAAIRGHHERWDGSGYPDRIAGDRIPEAARVIALAESYDTLTSPRPWREPLTIEAALSSILDGAGSQFDPEVVQTFFAARKKSERG